MARHSAIDLSSILNAYSKEVAEALNKTKDEVAKEAADELRQTSPKKHGGYAANWAVKVQGGARIVYNRKHYQLTHLLEFGHANRDGGRTPAHPHIKPVEEEMIEKAVEKTREAIEGAD